ncbi:hypothetical protein PISMIDRAFT_345731 [Pisolithus microcarpus 441]|uniref:Uncharacterized protein n=1 Tax=Pisolithus microcarpus 441 TaxID=765257 RepID=A0A0C9YWY5_9AGAM|nr:hypothetical protein PISMIDRAFT_345731 [Pisolithus microcarpus 441]
MRGRSNVRVLRLRLTWMHFTRCSVSNCPIVLPYISCHRSFTVHVQHGYKVLSRWYCYECSRGSVS